MDNLNDLLRALTSVLVRYNMSKCAPQDQSELDLSPEKRSEIKNNRESDLVKELLAKSIEERMTSLTNLIDESTKEKADRKPLLEYLYNHIKLVDEFIHSEPFNQQSAACDLSHSISTLLKNLKSLFTIKQIHSLEVNFDDKTVSLWGFAWSNSQISIHIQDLIMKPLDLTLSTEDRVIDLLTKNLSVNQQVLTLDNACKMLSQENELLKREKQTLVNLRSTERKRITPGVKSCQPMERRKTLSDNCNRLFSDFSSDESDTRINNPETSIIRFLWGK